MYCVIFLICSGVFSGCGPRAPAIELCVPHTEDAEILDIDGRRYVAVEDIKYTCVQPDEEKTVLDKPIFEQDKPYICSPLQDTLDLWDYCKFKQ